MRNIKWDTSFQAYLFGDVKLSPKGATLKNFHSRFTVLKNYFQDKEFNRTNFTTFLMEKMNTGLKNGTLNNYISTAKHIASYIHLTQKIDTGIQTYTYFGEQDKHIEILTPDELQGLIDAKMMYTKFKEVAALKWHLVIKFMVLTGCRVSECANLKVEDLYDDYVVFRDTKNKKDRYMTIPKELSEQMKKISGKEYVFVHHDGRKIQIGSIYADMKKRAEVIGIKKKMYPHLLRHSFITTMLQYCDALMVAKMVGHSNLNSTRRYDHRALEELRVNQAFHPLLRKSITLDKIASHVKKTVTLLVDKREFISEITESPNELLITIKKVYA